MVIILKNRAGEERARKRGEGQDVTERGRTDGEGRKGGGSKEKFL